jgi:hypothetical protein
LRSLIAREGADVEVIFGDGKREHPIGEVGKHVAAQIGGGFLWDILNEFWPG